MELAKAYVQIIPTTEGIKDNITTALGGEPEFKNAGTKSGANFMSGIMTSFEKNGPMLVADFAKKVLTIETGAVAGLVAGYTATFKEALDAYGEFEQLTGGAELMFGDAYEYVSEKASTAFRDVQMSQSAYLEQVNGFAVGLKTAMDGNEQAAAELADRIVKAEADVVAATGRDREAVENAFNGIMRNNFTMLDNLGLGINATKEGMQTVIDTVNEWNASNGRVTNYTIENLADIQSALVDYIDMQGLAGYASMEGATTIQGSFATLKASWNDLLVGLMDENANLDTLVENFATSFVNVASGIVGKVPQFTESLLKGIASAIRTIDVSAFKDSAFEFMGTLTDSLVEAYKDLGSIVPDLIEIGIGIIDILIGGIMEYFPQWWWSLTTTGTASLISAVFEKLPELAGMVVEVLRDMFGMFSDNLHFVVEAGEIIIPALIDGIHELLPKFMEMAPELLESLSGEFKLLGGDIVELGSWIIGEIIGSITADWAEWLGNGLLTLIDSFWTQWSSQDWSAFGSKIVTEIINSVANSATKIWDTVKNAVAGGNVSATSTNNFTSKNQAQPLQTSTNVYISGDLSKLLTATTNRTQKLSKAYGYNPSF